MRRSLALIAALATAAVILLGVNSASPAVAAPGTWLSRINTYRAQNGLGPLTEDVSLNAVAQNWTSTMAATNTLAHNPLLGSQVTLAWTRLAENVGYGQDEGSLFQSFVNSSGHRANLLGAYNGVGIGQVVSGGTLWTTHVFVATTSVLRPPATAVTGLTAAAGRPQGGMWMASSTGKVVAKGGAPHFGQVNFTLNKPVVGMAATPSGGGYWLVASDGGIFPFGDAGGYGSTGAIRLNQPIVGMAASATGRGYWMVASDGGIFPFGDAGGYGSTGAIRLNQPMVSMSRTATGRGYWLVAADGGIFPFGDARGFGSLGAIRLNQPITNMASTPLGDGYWLLARDGGLFPFGRAPGFGSLGGSVLTSPVVAMAVTPTGRGYWLVKNDGSVASFGDAPAV